MYTMEFNPINLDWNLLFTIINLAIFYFLIKRFLWDKIIAVLDKRKDMIDKHFKDAEDANKEADELKTTYESKMAQIQDERSQIIEDAKVNAKTQANTIIQDAHSESFKLKAEARRQIEFERETAIHNVHDSIASIAMQAAQKVVENNADIDNSAIYNQFIEEIGDEQ